MAGRILFLNQVPPPPSLTHPHIRLACKADATVFSNMVPLQAGSMQLQTVFANQADAAQRSVTASWYALTAMVFLNQVPRQVSSAHPRTASARKADTAQMRACHARTATAVFSNQVPLQAGSMQIHAVFAGEADAAQRRPCHALTATVFSNQVPRQASSAHPPTASACKADTAQRGPCHARTSPAIFSNQVPLQAGSMHPRTAFADGTARPSAMVDCHALTATTDRIFFPNQTSLRADSAHSFTATARKTDTAQLRACHALNMTPLRFARQKPPLPSARGSVSDSEPRPEGVGAQLLMTLCLTVTMVFRNQSSALAGEANAVRLIEAVLGEV